MSTTADICRRGGTRGWIFPLADAEQDLNDWLRAFLYGGLMVYFFYGVAVIADTFMASIETIANRKTQVSVSPGRVRTKLVWNRTVATLSLMALGSSAPEISLSLVDLVKKEFHFSPMGTATIIGSAAFNLLVIVATCIVAIPACETRVIFDVPVFYLTSFFSIVAYMWVVVILVLISQDRVEVWEALTTFLMFFVLLYSSYKVDVGDCDRLMERCVHRFGLPPEIARKRKVSIYDLPTIVCEAEVLLAEKSEQGQELEVKISLRDVHTDETVKCKYHMESLGALPDLDYVEQEGELEFSSDAPVQTVTLSILGRARARDARFLLVLDDAEGCQFDEFKDGGVEATHITCVIKGKGAKHAVDLAYVSRCWAMVREQWTDNFWETIYCNGSLEEQKEAGKIDWVCHFVGLPWKLLFMCVPPTTCLRGWGCFWSSLLWIGVLTAVLSDLAELIGCVMEVPEIVTSITLVALGTSMPDLFASLAAAREDRYADASIVNVTGSNAVNVFLGLGLPWSVGSIYWQVVGRTPEWERRYPEMAKFIDGPAFVVNSTNLGFCVVVFICTTFLAISLLFFRRRAVGGELGGNFTAKVVTALTFVASWVLFVVVVSWRTLRYSSYTTSEFYLVIGAALIVQVGLGGFTFGVLLSVWENPAEEPLRMMSRSNTFSSVGTTPSLKAMDDLEASVFGRTISNRSGRSSCSGSDVAGQVPRIEVEAPIAVLPPKKLFVSKRASRCVPGDRSLGPTI